MRPCCLKGRNCFGLCLGPCYTDFNTGKPGGNLKKVRREKNVFAQKYDEIRRFDGTECAVNKKKFEARPKLKVGGSCLWAHKHAFNVFFGIFWSFSYFMNV